ncbi:MAG: glutamine synthetase [Myxococcota bacterium]
MLSCVEYIWLDGTKPTQQLRSKTRVTRIESDPVANPSILPTWGFDGSSTEQAPGNDTDLVLQPVCSLPDPLRGSLRDLAFSPESSSILSGGPFAAKGLDTSERFERTRNVASKAPQGPQPPSGRGNHYLVLCEVLNTDGSPHSSSTRARLREQLQAEWSAWRPWIGFEQEYTLFQGERPYGWPQGGIPGPQGRFYCGVGAHCAYGRALVERHLRACLAAGLCIFGVNAEVMPSQWEFQVGYRGLGDPREEDLLTMCDHTWLARWLLLRLGEEFGITVNFSPKPLTGDWNGAGAHTNFSTQAMRNPQGGWEVLQKFTQALAAHHQEHIDCYGVDLDRRLTGKHETCRIDSFKAGERDRGASVRIPHTVAQARCGYIEDRRPGANCDPYRVCHRLLQTYATIA